MKRITGTLLAAALALGGTVGQANAAIITSERPSTGPAQPNGLMSTVAGTTTITFNGSMALPAGFTGGSVVSGTNTGIYAAPNNDTSNFFAVGGSSSGVGTASFTPGGSHSYFGLYWGSIDSFNTITFSLGGSTVGTFAGSAFPPANGNQNSPQQNEFIDFSFTGGSTYDRVTFTTTTPNFELDNVAFDTVTVPEPASLSLLAVPVGLAGMLVMRRKRNTTTTA